MPEKHPPGRPRVLTDALLTRIVLLTAEPPEPKWTIRRLASELGVSSGTIQAALKSLRKTETR